MRHLASNDVRMRCKLCVGLQIDGDVVGNSRVMVAKKKTMSVTGYLISTLIPHSHQDRNGTLVRDLLVPLLNVRLIRGSTKVSRHKYQTPLGTGNLRILKPF